MQKTATLFSLTAVALISLGVLAASGVSPAIGPGGNLTAPLLAGGIVLGAAIALYWVAIWRLGAILRVAERLAGGELGATVARPGSGLVGRLERSINAVSTPSPRPTTRPPRTF